MLFTDSSFLFYFLPLALLLHRIAITRNIGGEYGYTARLVMFGLTLVFYGLNATWWLYFFLLSIGFDLLWAYLLGTQNRPALRRVIVGISVLQNLLLLALLKYPSQWVDLAEAFFPNSGRNLPRFFIGNQPANLPPGISFYTFESLSFVIDVYRRVIPAPKNPLDFLGFIGMFPRFVAGPIVRYKTIVEQLHRYGGMDLERGMYLFLTGLFLKCVFADSFGSFVPLAFEPATNLSFFGAWLGVLGYAFQLYFDFSGYSLMAIGLGRCFGFRFPTNFNRPYLATSLRDFWRRWHISLSMWLRDYVYFSLGGNKQGKLRTYLNLIFTMLIGGVWHGSGLTFVVWGLWHGLWLCAERAGLGKSLSLGMRRGVLGLVVLVGWVPFRAQDLSAVRKILAAMFFPFGHVLSFPLSVLSSQPFSLFCCVAGIWYCFVYEKIERPELGCLTRVQQLEAAAIFLISLVSVFGRLRVPFLYYRF